DGEALQAVVLKARPTSARAGKDGPAMRVARLGGVQLRAEDDQVVEFFRPSLSGDEQRQQRQKPFPRTTQRVAPGTHSNLMARRESVAARLNGRGEAGAKGVTQKLSDGSESGAGILGKSAKVRRRGRPTSLPPRTGGRELWASASAAT